VHNWWRQGMMGAAISHYECIKAFSETDFTEDLKRIDVPVLVMHGDDDQIVPYADAGVLSAKLLKRSTLKIYKSFPHGMCTTHAEEINHDLRAFIRGGSRRRPLLLDWALAVDQLHHMLYNVISKADRAPRRWWRTSSKSSAISRSVRD